ncbi:MMPL family transporter [Pseudoclavibacter chungangensis]|uniref:MMPL family transporter n=1 Tax=Pseudoclavibacter chungangensis TaxID=587635 RepID=A0A7J5C1Y7_9MICO|nr:MMPL family transporter [Pseudoclavibacter chungangensis]KAB1662638.1 MMPL family transporter [Pseudoclavibacter chungangensis]
MRRGPQLATWIRVVAAVLLIGAWFAAGSIGGPYFGKVGEVSSNDQTNYLPTSADATRVQELLPAFNGTDAIPAILVYTSAAPLTDAQLRGIDDAVAALTDVDGVGESSPPIPSEDGLAVQMFVPLDRGGDVGDEADALRAAAVEGAPDGVTVHLTGPAGFASDLSAAFAGIDGLLLLVALLAVLVILVIVYRSPLLPFLVLGTSVFALCAALLTVWWLAKWGVLLLSGQTQGILFILVIGAATDYSLLYVARYREALVTHRTKWDATWAALRGSIEPIAASGGTVIAGLLCLLLSDLKSNSTLGPVAAIGIVFAMLSALTLLPALLYWAGRVAFWPRRTAFDADHDQETDAVPTTGLWARLSCLVERRPRAIWVVTTIVLAVACLGVLQLKADGVPASDLVLGESDARDGQVALGEHFPGGSGSPVYVVAPQDAFDEVTAALLAEPGVSGVAVTSADSPSGSATVTTDGVQAFGPPGTPAPEPTVVDGDVLVQATLTDAADSAQAEATVRQIRATLDDIGATGGQEILIGGVTATAIDTNEASIHDRNLIIPLVLVVIMLILMLLLRSILAPVLLVLTTVLSFGTAMGVSALVFNHVLDLPGADPAVPLFGFVFLVALGIDYNIFLMTRVREESLAHGTREGVMRGLAITGGVITSAGIVLAATFAALGVIPILFLLQLAVIVAFGVLLDTLVVRTLLVPALVHDLGRVVWWPSALSRGKP